MRIARRQTAKIGVGWTSGRARHKGEVDKIMG